MTRIGSFVDMVKSRRVDNLFLVNAFNNDRACWFYLQVDSNKIIFFEKKIKETGSIDLDEWGRVVISGWGAEPPLKVQEKIKAEGSNFNLTEEEVKQEIFFLQSVSDDGVPFFSFVTVPIYLAHEFQEKCAVGGFDYREYGAVVYSDWGVNPSERVLQLMEIDYNLNRQLIAHRLPKELTS